MAVYDRHAYKNSEAVSAYLCFGNFVGVVKTFCLREVWGLSFMSKNLRALTAIVLSQLLIECMGFFLGIPLSKILVLTVLSSIAEVLMHLVLGKKSKVTLSDKEIWHQYFLFVKKTLWLSILFVGIFLFYTLTKSDSFMLYFYWHIFVLFHCLGYIIWLNNIKMNRKNWRSNLVYFHTIKKSHGSHHLVGIFAIKINKAMSSYFGLGPQSLHSHYCHE